MKLWPEYQSRPPPSSSPRLSPSFMPPILFGSSTPMRPREQSRHKRASNGLPQGRREKEEITLYCILVNWRGEKIGAATFPKKGTPDRFPFTQIGWILYSRFCFLQRKENECFCHTFLSGEFRAHHALGNPIDLCRV